MINRTNLVPKTIENKRIMQTANKFIAEKKLKHSKWDKINHIRLQKKMIIPAELVGGRGRKQTEAYDKLEA